MAQPVLAILISVKMNLQIQVSNLQKMTVNTKNKKFPYLLTKLVQSSTFKSKTFRDIEQKALKPMKVGNIFIKKISGPFCTTECYFLNQTTSFNKKLRHCASISAFFLSDPYDN